MREGEGQLVTSYTMYSNPPPTFMNWSTDFEAREFALKRVEATATGKGGHTLLTHTPPQVWLITGMVYLFEGEDIQEREDTAVGQVEPD